MFEILPEKYHHLKKFLNYFEKEKQLPNSIIFYGNDIPAQYFISLLLARAMNCTGNQTFECNCANCSMIKENKHPKVYTVSKLDFKPEGDESKTVISKKQTDKIKEILMMTGDYHRFFIFCDVKTEPLSKSEQSHLLELPKLKFPCENWYPVGLNSKCFPDVSANALLKSIEEPPVNNTFIFLTNSPENLISTIVSRSQLFYVPGNIKKTYDTSYLEKILKDYPSISFDKIGEISSYLEDCATGFAKSPADIADDITAYFIDKLKTPMPYFIKDKMLTDVNKLDKVRKMAISAIKPTYVFEEIAFVLTNP